jgi:hypothetical protein
MRKREWILGATESSFLPMPVSSQLPQMISGVGIVKVQVRIHSESGVAIFYG